MFDLACAVSLPAHTDCPAPSLNPSNILEEYTLSDMVHM